MKPFFFIFSFLCAKIVLCQVTFIIKELPDNHNFSRAIYISGDFEGWTGGKEQYKFVQKEGQYQLTLSELPCNLQFKFTMGSWETVERNSDNVNIENRTYSCEDADQTIYITIDKWASHQESDLKSSASKNVHILSEDLEIPQLNRSRRIWVYLPPDYEKSNEQYPVLYMHDGQNLFDVVTSFAGEWNVDETLNRLYHEIGFKLIVVGIDNGQDKRLFEYSPWDNPTYGIGEGEAYAEFIVNTLKPFIDQAFRTLSDTKNTAMMGSSLGGLITHYSSLKFPNIFGKAGVLSPAFFYSNESFEFARQHSAMATTKMYFLAGDMESETMVINMDRMISEMKQAGYKDEDIQRKVVIQGKHNEKLWRDGFEEAIKWLFELNN